MTIILPKPPSVNNYWRHVFSQGRPRVYISKKGQEWLEEAGWKLKSQWKEPTIDGPVGLNIRLYVCGRYDIDNGNKALFDLLTKMGVIKDDVQIAKIVIEKIFVYHREDEKVEIEIKDGFWQTIPRSSIEPIIDPIKGL